MLGLAPAAALAARADVRQADAYIPLPNGKTLPADFGGHRLVMQGDVDERTVAVIDTRIRAANKQMLADLQRNIGSMTAKWNRTNGS